MNNFNYSGYVPGEKVTEGTREKSTGFGSLCFFACTRCPLCTTKSEYGKEAVDGV